MSSHILKPRKLNKRTRRKLVRWSLLAGNMIILLVVSVFIMTNKSTSQTVRSSTVNSTISTAASAVNPLDQLSSSQIALSAAQITHLPEMTAVRNQADSDSLTLSVVPNDTVTVAKPQIVATSLKSKQDIKHYVTQSGDTVASVAAKFGLIADNIRWSNSLNGDNLTAGVKLSIPPVNGIVYVVKAGDTPQSLATRYQSDPGLIIAYNDAELNGLKPGDQVIIPNGRIAAPVIAYGGYGGGGFAATYASGGYNGYDPGYCTYYVAKNIPVPSNWGNANTWDNYAALTPGWIVSTIPRPGAIAQTDAGGLGHVAIVSAVSPDGSQIQYSDMNGIAGFGRVGYSGWVSATRFQHYIYRG